MNEVQTPWEHTTYSSISRVAGLRIVRYRLQRKVRDIMFADSKDWRVCNCAVNRVSGSAIDSDVWANPVNTWHSPSTDSVHLSNLQVCGSVWTCPVCSAKISARRSEQVKSVLSQSGLTPILATLTLQHSLQDSLTGLTKDMRSGYSFLMSGRARQQFFEDFGIRGYIASRETRFGFKNGWHPHMHVLFLSDKTNLDEDEIKGRIVERYGAKLEKLGYLVNEHTVDVKVWKNDEIDEAGSCYLTKSSLEMEVTGGGLKESAYSYSPFQLVDMYDKTGNEIFAEKFREYANATKGFRVLTFSRGLLAKYGMEEESDEEIAVKKEKDATLLVPIPYFVWRRILERYLRAELLNLDTKGDAEVIYEWLSYKGLVLPSEDIRSPYENLTGRGKRYALQPERFYGGSVYV